MEDGFFKSVYLASRTRLWSAAIRGRCAYEARSSSLSSNALSRSGLKTCDEYCTPGFWKFKIRFGSSKDAMVNSFNSKPSKARCDNISKIFISILSM